MSENSGGDVNYYRVEVTHPKRAEPYVAECEDIIAALGMDFFEGEAFKAAWRKAAQRTLGIGKAGNTALRDAEKMAHYGARCLAIEQHRRTADLLLADKPAALPPEQWRDGDILEFRGENRANFSKGVHYQMGSQPGTSPWSIHVRGLRGFVGEWTYGAAAQDWAWIRRP